MTNTNKRIPHSECIQGKCADLTTGCWGECSIRAAFPLNNVACGDAVSGEAFQNPGHKVCYCGGWADDTGDYHNAGCPELAATTASASGGRCAACKGAAHLVNVRGNFVATCPDCNGTGRAPAPSREDAPMDGLLAAAEAVVARWDSPKWKDEPHTAVFIDRLRAALAQQNAELAGRIGNTDHVGRNLDGVPQPYAGAIVLLETIAECGALAFIGEQRTPMSETCTRFANDLRTEAGRRASGSGAGDSAGAANEMRIALTVQISELIDVAERYARRVHKQGDTEERDYVQGAIDCARKVAEPYNYNGPYRAHPGDAPAGGGAQ